MSTAIFPGRTAKHERENTAARGHAAVQAAQPVRTAPGHPQGAFHLEYGPTVIKTSEKA